MKVIRISDSLFPKFELILTAEAVERLAPGPDRAQDTFALGVVDDDMPLGAIAIKCSPPTAEVLSLYVVDEYRRLGIGSHLVLEAITDAMSLPGITELIVPYSESPGEDMYTSFFNGVGMEVVDVGAEYRVTVKDALSSPGLSDRFNRKESTLSWSELSSPQQKKLFPEGAGLYDYYIQHRLREDLVFVSLNEQGDGYRGCIAVVEENGELILAWLRADKSPILMMELIHCALRQAEENGEQDKVLRIPTINSTSDSMVKDLFGDTPELEYYSKRAVFDFDEE